MLAVELETTVEFPRLPLAKTVILTGTELQHNGKPGCFATKNALSIPGSYQAIAEDPSTDDTDLTDSHRSTRVAEATI